MFFFFKLSDKSISRTKLYRIKSQHTSMKSFSLQALTSSVNDICQEFSWLSITLKCWKASLITIDIHNDRTTLSELAEDNMAARKQSGNPWKNVNSADKIIFKSFSLLNNRH